MDAAGEHRGGERGAHRRGDTAAAPVVAHPFGADPAQRAVQDRIVHVLSFG
ncbi:hypothetical protein K7G98_18515 [Saccharothrix sp. MB29]|nr:hypothetical protein [Saccharothrix sp. MB29]